MANGGSAMRTSIAMAHSITFLMESCHPSISIPSKVSPSNIFDPERGFFRSVVMAVVFVVEAATISKFPGA